MRADVAAGLRHLWRHRLLRTLAIMVGAGFFAGGAAIAVWNVVTVSLRQRITPDRLLGRVNSGYRLVAWGTMPVGAAAGGLLAHAVGLRAVFLITMLTMVAAVAGMTRVTDKAMADAERTAAQ